MSQIADLVSAEVIEKRILLMRGQKVLLAADLATLYGVTTKRLHEQVRRNLNRFPEDFMFQLTKKERDELAAICGQFKNLKHSRVLPYAFTEHGALMLANVLNSERAVEVSIIIMRAFIRLRELLSSHKELIHKLEELERHIQSHDKSIQSLFDAIRQLMTPAPTKSGRIGFY